MARRPLPSPEEAREILATRRTRRAPRPAPPVGRSLSPFIKALDARFGQGPGVLQARWREIAGEVLAARTEPARLIKGRQGQGATLEIRVQGPAAALIQHQSTEILERVNLFMGPGAVARLRITQGPVTPPSARDRPSQPQRRRPRPLDAGDEAKLADSISPAAEPGLKTALMRLGRAVLSDTRRRD